MGKIKNNAIIEGMSGRIGNVILKDYPRGTIISSRPDRSKVKLSVKQKKANGNFKIAVIYAKAVMSDPEKKKAYEAKLKHGQSVYHAAIAEHLSRLKDL